MFCLNADIYFHRRSCAIAKLIYLHLRKANISAGEKLNYSYMVYIYKFPRRWKLLHGERNEYLRPLVSVF
jgi:hypothetical protein